MKTLSELNSKWWYRLIKVIYIASYLIIVVGSIVAIFYNFSPEFDNAKSYIKCENGKEFILSENGYDLYSDYMSHSNQVYAEDLCFDGIIEFKKEEIGNLEFKKPIVISETEKSGRYELISKYTNRDWFSTVGFSILTILGTGIIFEIFRRIFYYIILGSVRPKKIL